ncbi:MAG: DMT family transporter [Thalassovita sp.]
MVVILGIVWGGTFLFIELALEGITPFWLAAARISFAAVLLALTWQIRGGQLWQTSERAWGPMIIVGALSSAIPFMALSWGQQHVTSGFAGIAMACIPLMVLPLAHFFAVGERLNLQKLLGFAIGFVGVMILIGTQALESNGNAMEIWGRLACLSAAACYACSSILTRRLPAIDPVGLATVLISIGAIIVIPVAWVVEGPPPMPDGKTLTILAFLGLVPTAAANLLRVLVIRSAGSTFMSLTNYIVPVNSVVLGAVILHEPLPGQLIWALLLILSGMGLSQYATLKTLFTRTPPAKG